MIKKITLISGQMISLVIGYFLISVISGKFSGSTMFFTLTKEQEIAAGIGLLYVAIFFSGLLLYICKRSNWFGVKLFFAIITLHFGITVFLTQIESYVFLDQLVNILPKGCLPYLVLDNSISAILFSLLTVTISGKWKKQFSTNDQNRLKMSMVEWSLKFLVLGVLYYFIYTQFGAFVMVPLAGQEAFHAYYAGLVMPSWMFIFQVFRGMIWVLVALPLIAMLKGNRFETAVTVGLSFAILMGINLLIPVPFMPEKIRMAHFVEVMTSNFTYGMIASYAMLVPFWTRRIKEIAPERQGQTGTDTQQHKAKMPA
jgi:hypothetical protein